MSTPGLVAVPRTTDNRGTVPRPGVRSRAGSATLLLNGVLAARIYLAGAITAVVILVAEDDRIARVHALLNPRQLGRLATAAEPRR